MTLDAIETWSNVAVNAATAVALGVGGWWAYSRFIKERGRWPRAGLEQLIEHRKLDPGRTLLRVTVRVRNEGTTLLRLESVLTYVYRVLPLDDATSKAIAEGSLIEDGECEAEWPCIGQAERTWRGEAEIEPGERDDYGYDFVVPADAQILHVYSYVKNTKKRKRDIGWPMASSYDLSADEGQRTERVGSIASRR